MGVFTGERRTSAWRDDAPTAWVRVTARCDNACVFCLDADALDGSVRPAGDVIAEVEALPARGVTQVILSGGEPTASPHLLKIVRACRASGLRVALTTHGRVLRAPGAAVALRDAGVDVVRVSLHSGRRFTHDRLAGREGAWVDSLAGLRAAASAGLDVVLRMVLTTANHDDLGHLVHLAAMAGVQRATLIALRSEGAAARLPVSLVPDDDVAIAAIDALWKRAADEGVLLGLEGFGPLRPSAPSPVPADGPRSVDAASLAILRTGIPLPSLAAGGRAADADGRWGGFLDLAERHGGIAAVAGAFRAEGMPLHDLPPCVGGVGGAATDGVYLPACDGCALRAGCGGIARAVAKRAPEAFAPPA